MTNTEKELTTDQETAKKAPKKGELKLLALLFIIGMALFIEALKSDGIFQGVSSGPGSIPQLVSILLVLMVTGEAISLLKRGYQEGSLKDTIGYLFDKDVVILLVMVALYGLLVESLSFVPTSLLFLIGTMYLLDKNNPVKKVIISVATVAVLFLIFSTIFQVVLP